MKVIIIYSSVYGNTKEVAKAVSQPFFEFSPQLVNVSQSNKINLTGCDLLIIGSPTHGGRPVEAINRFIDNIPEKHILGKKVAVFDTRLVAREQKMVLRFLMSIIGYAASKMARMLTKKEAVIISQEGFFVNQKFGPLKEQELKKAKLWGESLLIQVR